MDVLTAKLRQQLGKIGRRKRILILVSVILCFVLERANASLVNNNKVNHQGIGVVNVIHQGKSKLWLGGEKGLFKITGSKEEKVDLPNDGTFNDEVRWVVEDENGRLWISSKYSSLSVWDPVTESVKKIELQQDTSHVGCWDMSFNSSGDIIVACGKQIFKININDFSVESLLRNHYNDELLGITEIVVDESNDIWFSTSNAQLFTLSYINATLKKFRGIDFGRQFGTITDLKKDSKGRIWVATLEGAIRIKVESDSELDIFPFQNKNSDSYISSIFEDNSNKVWLVGDTVYEIDFQNKIVQKSNMLHPTWLTWKKGFINSVTEGLNGEMLLAVNLLGIVEVPGTGVAISYLSDENENLVKNASFTLVNENDVYFSDSSDFYRFNKNDGFAKKIESGIGFINSAILMNSDNAVIAIDRRGILNYDLNLNVFEVANLEALGLPADTESDIFALESDQQGNYYVGFFGHRVKGLYKGNFESGFIPLIKDTYIDGALRSDEDELYFATRKKGVLQLDPSGSLRSWNPSSELKRIITNCLKQDTRGIIWLCTNGHGLAYLDNESESIEFVENIYTNHSYIIRDLVEDDDGNLWLMTGNGLVRYNPITKESVFLGKQDGIYDVDFEISASVNLGKNKILVAGDTYSYLIDTNLMNSYLDMRKNQETKVVLTNLLLLNKGKTTSEDATKRLNLALHKDQILNFSYDEFLFSFKFAANNYIERKTLGFEYRLQGLGQRDRKSVV